MTDLDDCGYQFDIFGVRTPDLEDFSQQIILVNESSIRDDFAKVTVEAERERMRRYWLSIIGYKIWRRTLENHTLDSEMQTLLSVLDTLAPGEYRACVPGPAPDRSLCSIVNDIVTRGDFAVLGPESQVPGEAEDGYRFVCIFCHEIQKKTGDLRRHLARKHGCSATDFKETFRKDNPQGLRVFGQYSYDDIRANRWNIKDWRDRKLRSDVSEQLRKRKASQSEHIRPEARPRIKFSGQEQNLVAQDVASKADMSQISGLTFDRTADSSYMSSLQSAPSFEYDHDRMAESTVTVTCKNTSGLAHGNTSFDLAGAGSHMNSIARDASTMSAGMERDLNDFSAGVNGIEPYTLGILDMGESTESLIVDQQDMHNYPPYSTPNEQHAWPGYG